MSTLKWRSECEQVVTWRGTNRQGVHSGVPKKASLFRDGATIFWTGQKYQYLASL